MKQRISAAELAAARSVSRMLTQLKNNAEAIGTVPGCPPDIRELCQALSSLAVSISNWSELDGHYSIWAAFTPRLPDFSESDDAYAEVD